MARIDAKTLLEAGVHFGHRTDKWNPKMKPYIFEARSGIHLINLMKTMEQLEKACTFLKGVAAHGGKALFVGCKKQSQEVVKELAQKSNSYYVSHRWLGGTLTNLNTIRKTVTHMQAVEEMEKNGKIASMPKQEAAALMRELAKIQRNLHGLRAMSKLPAVLIIVDPEREMIAVLEARKLGIPIVAINDTNSNPELIDYPIAGNDDAIRSIRLILDLLNESLIEGNMENSRKKEEKEKQMVVQETA